jgi:hypothetical protein
MSQIRQESGRKFPPIEGAAVRSGREYEAQVAMLLPMG